MTTIIKPGAAWWTQIDLTCSTCGTVFRLDADDLPSIQRASGDDRWRRLNHPCPVCHEQVRIQTRIQP